MERTDAARKNRGGRYPAGQGWVDKSELVKLDG
jgi:hypothetical protein